MFYFINIKILIFKDFMTKIKNDTMNESQLRKIYKYPMYSGDSKIYSDKGFVNIDNGSMGGTHWTCFMIKDNLKSDKFLLNHLPKPIVYHN